ncbi:MAG: DUF222 domain-containing protein [Ilumatobacteraceae bacterium]
MTSPPDTVYTTVRDTDPSTLDADGLARLTADIARLKAWCDARQVVVSRCQRSLAEQGRAAAPSHTLTRHGRQSGRDAAAAAERETVCTTMPGFESALTEGAVTSGHVDAVAAATRNLDDEARAEFTANASDLLEAATIQSVDAFQRACRDLARDIRNRHSARSEAAELERQRAASKITRWTDRSTGMHKTLIELDPVSDRELWTAIQRQRDVIRTRDNGTGTPPTRSWNRLTVDALLDLVTSSGGERRVPSISVHIDLDRLTMDAPGLCETDDGTPVPVETIRRLACEGDLIPVVLDGRGVVLDQGRAKRLATAEQRTALEAMNRTCSHPDCTVGIDDCRIHHVDPWGDGGTTDLDRLAPLCEHHHHLVHEGGWSFDIAPDRTGTWIRPDGTVYWTGPTNDRHLTPT